MSVSTKELFTAFFKGLAFAKGLNFGDKNRGMAEDRWITIHPFDNMKQGEADAGEGKGYYRRIEINDETGEIEKGLGAGTNIKDLSKTLKAKRKGEEAETTSKTVTESTGKSEKPKSRFPNYKAPEKKAEEVKAPVTAEKPETNRDYKKIFTDYIGQSEKEALTPTLSQIDHITVSEPDTSILDKEYYKNFKNKISELLPKLKGGIWQDQVSENLNKQMRNIVDTYHDKTQRKNAMWGSGSKEFTPEESRAKARVEKQISEVERYLKNPKDYEDKAAKFPEEREKILSDLDMRFKALTKMPNDRGTNTYLSKLKSMTEKLTKTGQYDITPDTSEKEDKNWHRGDIWNPRSSLTEVEEVRDEALKLIKSIDKNPKYVDVVANAKEGQFIDNRIKATEEQLERVQEREERKQERIDNLRDRARELQKAGHERANKGWEQLHNIPFGQPVITGRANIYKTPLSNIDQGYRQVDKGAYLYEKANKLEEGSDIIKHDDPLAIQKLQEKVENNVGRTRAYYQKQLDRALKTQSRAESGGLKAETKLYKMNEDFEDGRIRFKFDGKPRQEIIDIMKSRGFRWSPSNKAWQRQNTPNGVWSAKKVMEELKQFE